MKYVQVLPVCARQVFPHGTAEVGAPVGGKLPLLLAPQIKEIAVFSVRILAGFLKPLVFIGTVIHHQIHQDIHIPLFRLRDQPIHVLHRAETRIDPVIIRNIITLIRKRRWITGG